MQKYIASNDFLHFAYDTMVCNNNDNNHHNPVRGYFDIRMLFIEYL
jgi:hypothetical protein